MLTPDYLAQAPAPLVALWRQAEDDILRDAARRIGKLGRVSATADWQLWRREQIRLCRREVLKILAQYSGKSTAGLRRIFAEAATAALADDDRLYRSAGLDPPDPNTDSALLNLLNAGYRQTAGTWQNLTATTARTATGQFEAALDRAWLQVASGAFDYQTAIRRGVNDLAAQLPCVTYPSGHRDTLEVAVRRAVLTGVNQTGAKLQTARMEQMGWAYVEVSAHAGARPGHAAWQGRQYHRGGAVTYRGKYYPDFEKATGYGTGAGLCGWNCRHTFFAIDPDLDPEPVWSEEELAALDAKCVPYHGQLYTRYEISQKQRALERRIRAAKRSWLAEDAAGLDTAQSAVRLRQARQHLAQFVRETGTRQDSARGFVPGFGRSEAGRAAAQAKKATGNSAFTNARKGGILDKTNPDGGGVESIEINQLGKIDPEPLRDVFGSLRTTDVIVTDERISHIRERHPQDYDLFEKYGAATVEDPDLILQDTKHTGTIFMIRRLPDTNLNVVVRLALDTDDPSHKNSVMTFYRIRNKNLRKLEEKFPSLYKRE